MPEELAGQLELGEVCEFEHIPGDPVFTAWCARHARYRRSDEADVPPTGVGEQLEIPQKSSGRRA